MTYSLVHRLLGLDRPIIWVRPPDSLECSWLHGGGECRAGGSADFSCACSGFGPGRCRRAVFFGSVYVHDCVATNGVCWGVRSTLVAAVSLFPKLDAELEVLWSGCSAGLMEDKVDALWTRVRTASDSLVLHIPSSVARNPHDGVGE
jgi:hypothetical protein